MAKSETKQNKQLVFDLTNPEQQKAFYFLSKLGRKQARFISTLVTNYLAAEGYATLEQIQAISEDEASLLFKRKATSEGDYTSRAILGLANAIANITKNPNITGMQHVPVVNNTNSTNEVYLQDKNELLSEDEQALVDLMNDWK